MDGYLPPMQESGDLQIRGDQGNGHPCARARGLAAPEPRVDLWRLLRQPRQPIYRSRRKLSVRLMLGGRALGAQKAQPSILMAAGLQQNLQRVLAGLHRQFTRGATAAAGEQPHLSYPSLGLGLIHDDEQPVSRAVVPAAYAVRR